MKLTIEWLTQHHVTHEYIDWFASQGQSDPVEVLTALITENRLEWANWLIVQVMTEVQRIRYAIFAASQVLDIFEQQYPDDKRPREAIEAARKCLTEANASAASHASHAAQAGDDACAASKASAKASAAAYAAHAAACAASHEVYAASHEAPEVYYAASHKASAAIYAASAAYAAFAASKAEAAIQKLILEYGISLLREAVNEPV